MGIQDRDWYRDAQLEREKQEQLNATKARFSQYTDKFISTKSTNPASHGLKKCAQLFRIFIFWISLAGAVYVLMNYCLKYIPLNISHQKNVVENWRDRVSNRPGCVLFKDKFKLVGAKYGNTTTVLFVSGMLVVWEEAKLAKCDAKDR